MEGSRLAETHLTKSNYPAAEHRGNKCNVLLKSRGWGGDGEKPRRRFLNHDLSDKTCSDMGDHRCARLNLKQMLFHTKSSKPKGKNETTSHFKYIARETAILCGWVLLRPPNPHTCTPGKGHAERGGGRKESPFCSTSLNPHAFSFDPSANAPLLCNLTLSLRQRQTTIVSVHQTLSPISKYNVGTILRTTILRGVI